MAHEIETAAFGRGKPAWHELGTVVEGLMTVEEVIRIAQIDWLVESQEVFTNKEGVYTKILGYRANVRVSDGLPLGVVSEDYKIIQNYESLKLMDNIMATKEAVYDTAGSIRKGQVIWISAVLPNDILLANQEEERIRPYFMLTNSFDGKSGVKLKLTPVRVVCNNTLSIAIRGQGTECTIRHIGNIEQKSEEARRALGMVFKYYESFKSTAERLMMESFSINEMEQLTKKLFSVTEETSDRMLKKAEEIVNHFKVAPDLANVRGTKWAAYNAVTDYIDHSAGSRRSERGSNAENKLYSNLFGSLSNLRQRAFELIMV